MDLSNISTTKLVDELRKREGVITKEIGYNEPILVESDEIPTGPAVVLVVID